MMGKKSRPLPDVDFGDFMPITMWITDKVRDGHWRDLSEVQDFDKWQFWDQECPQPYDNVIAPPQTRTPQNGEKSHEGDVGEGGGHKEDRRVWKRDNCHEGNG